MARKKINLSNHSISFHIKAIEITVIALALLVPVVFHPRCYTHFASAKEFTFEALVIIGLMFWALKMISREEIKFASTPLNFPILSFIAICILSLIWSDTFFISLKELPLFLAGPLLYFIIVNNIRGEKQINRIIATVVLIGTALGIYGIFQYNGIDFSFWTHNVGRSKVFGLFGNPGYFAGYLILPLSLTISLFFASKNRNRKILFLIGILATGTTLILTFTRSFYLALAISSIFMFLLFLVSRGKKFIKENEKIFIFLLIVIILAVSLFIIPTPLNKPGTAISQIKGRVSITQLINVFSSGRRIAIWKFTGMMIKDRPILGSGIGTFKYNTLRYQAKFFEQGDNRFIYPYGFADKAHNEYLQLWAELGTIGLAIFLWLIIAYFNYGIRYLKREKDEQKQGIMIGLMGAVMAFLIDSFIWFPLHLAANVSLLWLFIGLTMVMGLEKKAGSVNKSKRNNIYKFKPVLYTVIILLAAFLCITVARPFVAKIVWFSGFKEVEDKDWEKATEIYESALKWDPYLGALYYDLGKVFLKRGLGNTALKSFKKAERYIDFPGLPLNIAIIYLAKGDTDNGIIELKRAISYQPVEKMPLLYVELGNVYSKLEKHELAEAAFKDVIAKLKKAISYQPTERTMAPLYFELGNVYLQFERYESAEIAFKDAIAKLKKAISYQPTERTMAPLYFELGNAYLKLKKYELTEVAFKNAIRINSNLLTDDSLKQNRTDKELVELKNKINSNLVDAHYKLAEAYLRRNKVEEGLVELKKVVELGPESEQAKYARDIIQKIEQAKLDAKDSN
ncbi:MAG: O-antigen ligase family protein [Candidatus Atribacteria bacterium]